ncbi:MAG: hypothetical protein BA873_05530 [Desulfobulbaceae bacterium C00003063]|nr:MAG: hypothetical protein BA873_05530 [Desulfobulbaceae bacterium C00003063]
MKKTILLAVLFAMFSSSQLLSAQCTTTVSGIEVTIGTWTKEGSPYCVDGHLLIENLIIEPGVRVEFLGNYVFEVAGVLTAIGTKEDPIVFARAETNTVGWQGIYFNNKNRGSKLAYCTIEGSVNSGLRILNSLPSIENCIISNNNASQGGGININLTSLAASEKLLLIGCTVTDNTSLSHGGGIRRLPYICRTA